ncbi:MAG: hypothetical protein ABWY00_18780 [Dongiaceae bacterium]
MRDSPRARPKFAIVPSIAAILFLAACTSGGQSSSSTAPSVTSSIPSSDPARIDLTVRDPLPVTTANLVDPNGVSYPAIRIDRDHIAYSGNSGLQSGMGIGTGMGVGIGGGSRSGVSSGVGIGIPLFSSGGSSPRSFTESRISFRVPDVAAYRSTWQGWKIHLDLAESGSSRSMEIPPPAPPPQ